MTFAILFANLHTSGSPRVARRRPILTIRQMLTIPADPTIPHLANHATSLPAIATARILLFFILRGVYFGIAASTQTTLEI